MNEHGRTKIIGSIERVEIQAATGDGYADEKTRSQLSPPFGIQRNRGRSYAEGSQSDNCGTPGYALQPILKYIKSFDRILESAPNSDNFLATALAADGYPVYSNYDDFLNLRQVDIAAGTVQVTNPPYSKMFKWLRHSYQLQAPFALLTQTTAPGRKRIMGLIREYGAQFLYVTGMKELGRPQHRIDFCMPNTRWDGKGSHFDTFWLTWGLGLPQQINFGEFVAHDNPYQIWPDMWQSKFDKVQSYE